MVPGSERSRAFGFTGEHSPSFPHPELGSCSFATGRPSPRTGWQLSPQGLLPTERRALQ